MIYILREQRNFDHKDLNLLDWPERSKGMSNKSLQGRIPLATLRIDDDDPVPDYFFSGGLPVVSSRFRALLLLFRADVEFLDVKLQPQTDHRYWFLNILRVVEAVDEERSEIRRSPLGVVSRITKLELLPSALTSEFPLFRAHEYEWLHCLNHELKTAIEVAGVTNVQFDPYSEYSLP